MSKKKNKILFLTYECAPFFKMGGLGDVAGSLPKALVKLGIEIRVMMPYYEMMKNNFKNIKLFRKNIIIEKKNIYDNREAIKWNIDLYKSYLPGSRVPIYFISEKKWFGVKNIFDKNGQERFAIFSFLATEMAEKLKWNIDIIHANDWQTGLTAVIQKLKNDYIMANERTVKNKISRTLYTIHNLAYTGKISIKILEKYGFRKDDFDNIDEQGKVNIMREAILSADIINTVSPNYAKEILFKEFGSGLEDVLNMRKKNLYGIVNGLDEEIFNPIKDKNIKSNYEERKIERKLINKEYLQKISKLPGDDKIPLVAMISRLTKQKGFDLLKEFFEELMREDLQLVILGSGVEGYDEYLKSMAKKYHDKFKVYLKFDAQLANQIYAGADIFLMPSKYEPCGLGQLIAMKYGTVPIVRSTGGLKDTVKKIEIKQQRDAQYSTDDIRKITDFKWKMSNLRVANGFAFSRYDAKELFKTIKQALAIYHSKKEWVQLQKNGMKQNFSWDKSAREYKKLYQKIMQKN